MSSMTQRIEEELVDDGYLRLLEPKPTGRLMVSFHREVPEGDRSGILADAVGMSRDELAEMTIQSDPSYFDRGERAELVADFGLAIIPEAAYAGQMSVAGVLSMQKEVKFARPEFYMFATDLLADTTERTWGVAATGAFDSSMTGKGIRIAILDTGLDLEHPDFPKDRVVSKSFVDGESVDDIRGHGTHCAGTAAGSLSDDRGFRYSVAPEATLYAAKVLNNRGAGRELDIIAGISWALREGCEIISMSLGRAVRRDEDVTPEYEEIAQLALSQGALIIAAAGNNSTRQYGFVAPVSEPANSPSIMAVAALDLDFSVAYFSNGSRNRRGGEIDIAAPGVAVTSSFPGPKLYERLAGTSMACPHVAGIAALWAQSDPTLRGQALWRKLVGSALKLPLDIRDVGAGLVQAPVELMSADV